MIAKSAGILSGIHVARRVFKTLDEGCRVYVHTEDGESFKKGDELIEVFGPLPVLLTAERTALNFVQQLSGVATRTNEFVTTLRKLGGDHITIRDTRKTVPGLRLLQKAAVVHGGGHNHRIGLDDMVMLKNNHIDALGSISAAVAALKKTGWPQPRRPIPLCIEVRNLAEAKEAASQDPMPQIIMLDNMTPQRILQAANAINQLATKRGLSQPELEVSGGITLDDLPNYAHLPIQRISIGALTHSAPAADIAFRVVPMDKS
jgi:nicotinate-nucleotide pyrophosphorylase (carboxylating)